MLEEGGGAFVVGGVGCEIWGGVLTSGAWGMRLATSAPAGVRVVPSSPNCLTVSTVVAFKATGIGLPDFIYYN